MDFGKILEEWENGRNGANGKKARGKLKSSSLKKENSKKNLMEA